MPPAFVPSAGFLSALPDGHSPRFALVLRTNAPRRRWRPLAPDTIALDLRNGTVWRGARNVRLQKVEFAIVAFLLVMAWRCGDRPIPWQEIADFVYGGRADGGPLNASRCIVTYVFKVRPRIAPLGIFIAGRTRAGRVLTVGASARGAVCGAAA